MQADMERRLVTQPHDAAREFGRDALVGDEGSGERPARQYDDSRRRKALAVIKVRLRPLSRFEEDVSVEDLVRAAPPGAVDASNSPEERIVREEADANVRDVRVVEVSFRREQVGEDLEDELVGEGDVEGAGASCGGEAFRLDRSVTLRAPRSAQPSLSEPVKRAHKGHPGVSKRPNGAGDVEGEGRRRSDAFHFDRPPRTLKISRSRQAHEINRGRASVQVRRRNRSTASGAVRVSPDSEALPESPSRAGAAFGCFSPQGTLLLWVKLPPFPHS